MEWAGTGEGEGTGAENRLVFCFDCKLNCPAPLTTPTPHHITPLHTTPHTSDLKPDNIGFSADGSIKLLDFGLATVVRQRSQLDEMYEMTGFTGSLRYMSPEVAERRPYSERVDQYR